MLHAVGDGAIAAALDALEDTGGERWKPLRPRIEHGDMLQAGRLRTRGADGRHDRAEPVALHDRAAAEQRLGAERARTHRGEGMRSRPACRSRSARMDR